MPESPPTVFISYAGKDLKVARKLYNYLKRAGANPWLDKEFLLPGQRWEVEIRRAIRESRYFLVVLSSHSVSGKGYVHKEVAEALKILDEFPESEIFIIPVRLDDCSLSHERLRDLHWVDMFPSWNDGFNKILHAIGVQPGDNGIPWAGVGIIVAVIAGLIALSAWLVPSEANSPAWIAQFETTTMTPTSSPTHTSTISSATPVPPTDTPTSIPPTPTPVPPAATATDTPRPTATPALTATATHTPGPTATPTSTGTDTPIPVPTATPQPALTIYLRRTETDFAALSSDQVDKGFYKEGQCVYGDAAVQIGDTIYHFDKPEVGPGEPEQLPDPWRVEFDFEELKKHTQQAENCAKDGAGFNPKKAGFWVGVLDDSSAVGEDSPYSLTMKLYEGDELRESIQVFFAVGDAPGGPGDGPGGKPTPPP